MKNSEELDKLLKQALSSTPIPSEILNQKIKNRLKEREIMKITHKKRIASVFIAATLLTATSVTAYAWNYFTSKQYAEHKGDTSLAKAFDSKNAIEINKSTVSGGYKFTLHGIVSGKDISNFPYFSKDMTPERTYAVLSIEKQDGSKMPASQDEDYGKVPFFISPLIKGQKPWLVNIASMNGGYSESVIDGVMYRLIECDGVEMFADRGIYLCISSSNFYDVKAFDFNSETGKITPKANYNGFNVLFDLPLNKTKANHEKAEQYLEKLLTPPKDTTSQTENTPNQSETTPTIIEQDLENDIVEPISIK